MTQKNNLQIFPIETASLAKRMLIGGMIGLILISLFLSGTGEPNPAWGKFWMLKPLIIVPFAGAMGGGFNYLVSQQEFKKGRVKALAMFFSLIVFIIGLWLGSVLGLNGTYWN